MFSYYNDLYRYLKETNVEQWAHCLEEQVNSTLNGERYGDLPAWVEVLKGLPSIKPSSVDLLDSVSIGSLADCSVENQQALEEQLRQLIPWRKGPFSIFDIKMDTEWRSDWKWDRLLPFIDSLKGKRVLDVGCGNGYHCLRALGAGAERVIGIDPSPRFVIQFLCIKHFLAQQHQKPVPVDIVPIGLESMPQNLQHFDTTFSMGVLYHRLSPMEHLKQLRGTLKSGGQLILETLIIDGELGQCLVPEGRYAKMNNVWFLPSAPTLISWLSKCGFKEARLVDINSTTLNEQRRTDWMHWQSLEDFLDPTDHSKTIEGHPAPLRAIFTAQA